MSSRLREERIRGINRGFFRYMTHLDSKVKVKVKVTYVKVNHILNNTVIHTTIPDHFVLFRYLYFIGQVNIHTALDITLNACIFSENPRDTQAQLPFNNAGVFLGFSLDCHLIDTSLLALKENIMLHTGDSDGGAETRATSRCNSTASL